MTSSRAPALLLSMLLLAIPAGTGADSLQDCLTSNEVIGDCLARRQLESMRRLDRASEEVMRLAEQRDAPNDNTRVQAAFLAAAKAFDNYLESACKARGLLDRGPPPVVADDLERACKIDLLEERADALESLVQGKP